MNGKHRPPPTRFGGPSPLPAGRTGAAQMKQAALHRPPGVRYGTLAPATIQPKLSAPPIQRAQPRVIQRAAEAVRSINLSTASIGADYQELMRIWFSYSPSDGQNFGASVTKYFKIATALGIAAYTTDNHASGGSGGPGEGQKAQEEKAHYEAWLATHKATLDAVQIVAAPAAKPKFAVSDEMKQQHAVKKATHKAEVKVNKHQAFHDDPKNRGKRCGQCGKTV